MTQRRASAKNLSQAERHEPTDPREVERVAYELYERRGKADGHALDDWLKAEAVVRKRIGAQGVSVSSVNAEE